uniref:G-protein coupled receptors family 1 profile domain-containing protein n=1 Tax=Parascaris equorum TaxID=6256 RepID=A0A914S4Y3_PAREQ
MDIWMCTASIYNLVAISIDRYIAIHKPLNYPILITKFRARCIVAVVWLSSFIVCSPSFILASADKPADDKCKCTPCLLEDNILATSAPNASSSFYIPMVIVVFVYIRIYVAACDATKSLYSGTVPVTTADNNNLKNFLMHQTSALSSRNQQAPQLRMHRGSNISHGVTRQNAPIRPSDSQLPLNGQFSGSQKTSDATHELAQIVVYQRLGNNDDGFHASTLKKHNQIIKQSPKQIFSPLYSTNHGNEFKKAEKMAVTKCMKRSKSVHHRAAVSAVLSRLMRRTYRKNAACAYEKHLSLEIKAAKTVAIVTGCFIFCWLGFSILYGFAIETNPIIWSILFWLGYLNSALNPIIYTLFNREFRMCFKQLLTCNQLIFTQRSTRSRNCTSYSMVLNGTTNRIAGSFSLTSAPIKGTTNIPSSPRSTNTNNDEIIIEEMP